MHRFSSFQFMKGNSMLTGFLLIALLFFSFVGFAQDRRMVKGVVLDEQNTPVVGATIILKGSTSVGTIADAKGEFSLSIPTSAQTLVVSFIGLEPQEVSVANQSNVTVKMKNSSVQIEETVIVGYGQQKRKSIVGSITQTTGEVLERTGGVTNLGAALTGNLPGVITYASSGMPGADDPKIIIRTQSSWNNSDPLVMVDGVERSMSTVDISSVESISVLKDASATAVYGVKGANGVILITTKRGKEGKANIQVRANATTKMVSKLPEKYDSYDALMLRNQAIERELGISAKGWANYTAMNEIDKYRNPLTDEDWDRYPNVNWEDELFKDYAMSYNTSVSVSGGTKFVNYFSSVDFVHEGDMFKDFDNNRGYKTGYGYNRINVRSNLDFNLTKTTKFSANLFGSNGTRTIPWNAKDDDSGFWASAYRSAPDAMRPVYSDGTWGWYAPRNADVPNSVYILAMSGVEKKTTTKINTDFHLSQDLDFVLKGLDFKASISLDNTFMEVGRGINDLYNSSQRKWVNPVTGEVSYEQVVDAGTQLDFSEGIRWTHQAGSVAKAWPHTLFRKLYYTAQFNYAREFGKNEVTALGLFSREKSANLSEFPSFREDWVFRATYNYAMKYFFEANGAYNGSEKFGPGYRFAFFPSLSGGWMVSEETFMKSIRFLDMLKVRASWGIIGDDNLPGVPRFLYTDQITYGGNTQMGSIPANTPYTFYRIDRLGNPNISWETVEKRNLGIEYSFLNGLFAGSIDMFKDHRYDILVKGENRAIPSYFGVTPPVANLGIVDSKGYELELRINKKLANGLRLWANTNMNHAVNKVQFSDDPELKPTYRKGEGYAINQTRAFIDNGFLASWDDVYGSTERTTDNNNKLPGDYNIIDFNGDGTINDDDKAPTGYTGVPQNTYNATLGAEWKGLSLMLQFYGVNNVTREVAFPTFHSTSNVAFVEGSYWLPSTGGDIPFPRWTTTVGGDAAGTRYLYDGSYVRLKNTEIAYTFTGEKLKRFGMRSFKLYVSGSNLFMWTNMPDDRESNFSGGSSMGAYPTVKRINLGVDITL